MVRHAAASAAPDIGIDFHGLAAVGEQITCGLNTRSTDHVPDSHAIADGAHDKIFRQFRQKLQQPTWRNFDHAVTNINTHAEWIRVAILQKHWETRASRLPANELG